MRITAIRVGKLVSGSGFNNTKVELEAAIDGADDEDTTVDDLAAMCDQHIARIRGIDEMVRTSRALQEQVHDLTADRDRLRAEVDGYRKAVDQFEELGELAREKGLKGAELLPDGLPF